MIPSIHWSCMYVCTCVGVVCVQMDKCVYESKRVEFGGMRCQASGLWSQGEMVQSGAVVDDTRVRGHHS